MNTNRQTFARQLGSLRDQVLELSEIVESAIPLSINALENHDLTLAMRVDAFDIRINSQRWAIEEHAYELLATQQPNATDMRLIVAGVSVVNNLERISDYCAGIARLTVRLGAAPTVNPPTEFRKMVTTQPAKNP